ncbi:unnamed protein product [Owenia fusiformis]|uniref:Uncharacterized protein n=1 Tax=Owenia fusiformis TaxID=6347 RepID=A0A8J1XY64_OWEFU|nr:unnamed protein product [Owenia fusiformis]
MSYFSAFNSPKRKESICQHPPPQRHIVTYATAGLQSLIDKVTKSKTEILKQNAGICETSLDNTDDCFTNIEGQFQPTKDMPLMASRYKFIECIGRGQSSVLVKALDTFNQYKAVSIKVLHLNYNCIGPQEVALIRDLNRADAYGGSCTVRLLNTFTFDDHYCVVFEYLQPAMLTKYFKHLDRNQKLTKIRQVAIRLLTVLGFLQRQNVIHADLKPENILLAKEGDMSSLRVIDFGNAIHYVHNEVSLYYEDYELQTLLYRAPEVIYGMPFGTEVDLWSLGCVLAELFFGRPLFYGKDKPGILKEMTKILGPLPTDVYQRGKYFTELEDFCTKSKQIDGTLSLQKTMTEKSDSSIIYKNWNSRSERSVHLPLPGHYQFADFLSRLLRYDPRERMTPAEAFQHPFLVPEMAFLYSMPNIDGSMDKYNNIAVRATTYASLDGPYIDKNHKQLFRTSRELLKHGTGSRPEPLKPVAQVMPVKRETTSPQPEEETNNPDTALRSSYRQESYNFNEDSSEYRNHRDPRTSDSRTGILKTSNNLHFGTDTIDFGSEAIQLSKMESQSSLNIERQSAFKPYGECSNATNSEGMSSRSREHAEFNVEIGDVRTDSKMWTNERRKATGQVIQSERNQNQRTNRNNRKNLNSENDGHLSPNLVEENCRRDDKRVENVTYDTNLDRGHNKTRHSKGRIGVYKGPRRHSNEETTTGSGPGGNVNSSTISNEEDEQMLSGQTVYTKTKSNSTNSALSSTNAALNSTNDALNSTNDTLNSSSNAAMIEIQRHSKNVISNIMDSRNNSNIKTETSCFDNRTRISRTMTTSDKCPRSADPVKELSTAQFQRKKQPSGQQQRTKQRPSEQQLSNQPLALTQDSVSSVKNTQLSLKDLKSKIDKEMSNLTAKENNHTNLKTEKSISQKPKIAPSQVRPGHTEPPDIETSKDNNIKPKKSRMDKIIDQQYEKLIKTSHPSDTVILFPNENIGESSEMSSKPTQGRDDKELNQDDDASEENDDTDRDQSSYVDDTLHSQLDEYPLGISDNSDFNEFYSSPEPVYQQTDSNGSSPCDGPYQEEESGLVLGPSPSHKFMKSEHFPVEDSGASNSTPVHDQNRKHVVLKAELKLAKQVHVDHHDMKAITLKNAAQSKVPRLPEVSKVPGIPKMKPGVQKSIASEFEDDDEINDGSIDSEDSNDTIVQLITPVRDIIKHGRNLQTKIVTNTELDSIQQKEVSPKSIQDSLKLVASTTSKQTVKPGRQSKLFDVQPQTETDIKNVDLNIFDLVDSENDLMDLSPIAKVKHAEYGFEVATPNIFYESETTPGATDIKEKVKSPNIVKQNIEIGPKRNSILSVTNEKIIKRKLKHRTEINSKRQKNDNQSPDLKRASRNDSINFISPLKSSEIPLKRPSSARKAKTIGMEESKKQMKFLNMSQKNITSMYRGHKLQRSKHLKQKKLFSDAGEYDKNPQKDIDKVGHYKTDTEEEIINLL